MITLQANGRDGETQTANDGVLWPVPDFCYAGTGLVKCVRTPADYRMSTLKPLPLVTLGAALVLASPFIFPWLEYTTLDEGRGLNSYYRRHVRVGLFSECAKDDLGRWACRSLLGNGGGTAAVQTAILIGVILALVSLVLALYQAVIMWLSSETRWCRAQQRVPGVLLLDWCAGAVAFVTGLLLTISLALYKVVDGGSGSVAFLVCGLGAICLFCGGVVAWLVAFEPTRQQDCVLFESAFGGFTGNEGVGFTNRQEDLNLDWFRGEGTPSGRLNVNASEGGVADVDVEEDRKSPAKPPAGGERSLQFGSPV
ncbi:uncharacterized protein LOC101862485 [Aplysia californica]|uniref:Uncharacterized protein LOC101862485 n=1 Tax=Aplysia californica TaxID=6500 RepID=A0ABM0ZW84_APLCA|nr:uncharacterized protein LOC101862485 [Aplysia californica]